MPDEHRHWLIANHLALLPSDAERNPEYCLYAECMLIMLTVCVLDFEHFERQRTKQFMQC